MRDLLQTFTSLIPKIIPKSRRAESKGLHLALRYEYLESIEHYIKVIDSQSAALRHRRIEPDCCNDCPF